MPEHTSWLTYLLAYAKDTLSHNAHNIGDSFVAKHHPSWQSFEPIATALLIAVLVLALAAGARSRLSKTEEAVIPEDRLSLRTFMEVFLGYFYDLAKSVMGPDRAKKYFPIVGASALFVFFCNIMALLPGMPIATTSLSITLGCALVVFLFFNFYGLSANGWHYIKHLAGPVWYLYPLIFVIELFSTLVRPLTLAVRLMLNMAVDHLILGIFLGLVCVFVPVPLMVLGVLVILIQTLVFSLLTCIYIGLATEPMHHDEHHAHH